MNIKDTLLLSLVFILGSIRLEAQITGYSTFAEAMAAVPFCDLGDLDGKTAKNPPFVQSAGQLPCNNAGGRVDNIIIFPFIATSNVMEIKIINQICAPVFVPPFTYTGLQAGILQDTLSKFCLDIEANDLTNGSTADITLSSNSFIPGNRYFLWIDGNGGAVCDFTLRVSKGNGAAPTLKEIAISENILNGIMIDSVIVDTVGFCIGPDTLDLEIPSDGLSLQYKWIIEPTVPNVTPMTLDSNKLRIVFDAVGDYQIKAIASNACSESDTLRLFVNVSDLPKTEVFPNLTICPENLGAIGDSLLKYDPNEDGEFGWGGNFGTFIIGQDTTLSTKFINRFNCEITQLVNLKILDSPAPGRDTVFSCGPYDNNGTPITSSQSLIYKPNVPTFNGCDTSVIRYIYIPKVEGRLVPKICNKGKQDEIAFEIDSIDLLPGTNLSYRWIMNGAGTITDTDGLDTILKLINIGEFTLEITADYQGQKCLLPNSYGSVIYEGKGLEPAKPAITIENVIFCPGDQIIRLKAESDKATQFNWTLPANANIIFSTPSGDSITVDLASIQADTVFKVAVNAENGCGKTLDVQSLDLYKVSQAKLDFNLPMAGCIGNNLTIGVDTFGTAGYRYTWDLGGGSVVRGSLTTYDQLEATYPSAGNYKIKLSALHSTCGLYDTTQSISFFDPLVSTTPSCRSDANTIRIMWPGQACVDNYEVIANGVSLGIIDTLGYKIDGLGSDSTINFEIIANNSCGCDSISLFASCSTINCELIEINTSVTDSVICESDGTPIMANTAIPSSYFGGFLSYEGEGIDQAGIILPGKLPLGFNEFKAIYDYQGCIVESNFRIEVKGKPQVEVLTNELLCIEDIETTYEFVSDASENVSYTLNGQTVNASGMLQINTDYILIATNSTGCKDTINFNIQNNASSFEFLVEGNTTLFDDEILNLKIIAAGDRAIDSVRWLVNGLLICQTPLCTELISFNLSPGLYNHDLTVFFGECQVTNSFVVEVKPSIKVFVPNAFSPSAEDFDNRVFTIFTNDFNGNLKSLKIFSRWGELVHQQNADSVTDFSWDGLLKARPVEKGVYVYCLEYEDEKGVLKTKIGDVTIY